MKSYIFEGRWLIAAAMFFAFCSRGDSPSLTSPSSVGTLTAVADGKAGASAVGDVKIGNGVLEIVRLRMTGGNAGALYVNPNGSYAISKGATIELWAEWDPAGLPRNPRFIVNWGEGEADFTGCGACKLTHKFNAEALFTVTASLDDLSGTMVTRKFTLDSRPPVAAPSPSPSPSAHEWIDSYTRGGQTVYKFPSRPLPPSPDNLAVWYQGICEDQGLAPVSCDYHIYGSRYDARAWNAVILDNHYWSCNVSDGINGQAGWTHILTFHNPLYDDRGVCEQGCSITGSDVFPICTDPDPA